MENGKIKRWKDLNNLISSFRIRLSGEKSFIPSPWGEEKGEGDF